MPEQKTEEIPEEIPEQTTYFGDSNKIDPTPGWIPFAFVLAIVAVFLICFVVAAFFIL